MRAFLQRLLVATQWGAGLVAVAACSSSINSGQGGGGSATATDAGADAATGTAPGDLQPLPDGVCSGPIYDAGFGYHGQCCEEIVCTDPLSGLCPGPTDARPALQGKLPPGSGSCECSPLRGPFAASAASTGGACCYLVGSIGCDGRPLIVDGRLCLADVLAGKSAWSEGERDFAVELRSLDPRDLPLELRARVARRWIERARFEHASIASFSRFSLALMSLGAPPALLEATHRAALDEVEHARIALSVASAYAGEPLAFGPLRVEGAFSDLASLEAAAVATVREACVGETVAAIEAAEAAAQAGPRAVQLGLAAIAEDETRHAELGWAFVRWALGMGDARLRERVAAAFAEAAEQAVHPRQDDLPAGHGFLTAAESTALRRRVLAEVIRPATQALLAGAREAAVGDRAWNRAREQAASAP